MNDGDDIRDRPMVLNPHLRVVQCGDDELLVKHGFRSRFSTLLRDEGRTGLLAVVLRAFREPSTLADLERSAEVAPARLADVSSLVAQLCSQQVLIRPSDYLPRVYLSMRFGNAGVAALEPKVVGIVGCGYLGSRIALELARVRVDRMLLLDDRVARREDAAYFDCPGQCVEQDTAFVQITERTLHHIGYKNASPVAGRLHDDTSLASVFERCGFVVVALERFSPTVLHAANRAALAAGRPWMSAYFDGSEAVIGPVYVPGDTACYNEFEIQNEACIARQDDYHVYKESLTPPSAQCAGALGTDPVLPPFLSIASVRQKTPQVVDSTGYLSNFKWRRSSRFRILGEWFLRIGPFRAYLRGIDIMREVHRSQLQLGEVAIDKIWINPKSRDDIPAVLKGLQHIWCDEALREQLYALLDEHILPEADRTVGRPGMDLWQILVLGVLKQGLGCDFDRLHELTNHHDTIRAFLGHGDFGDKTHYEYQTVVDNVSLLTPELLSAVGRLVVESGHKVAKKKPGEPLRGRCDSFVVETDVHYPTDVNLLWDAMRCLVRETGRAAERYGVRGWRQWRHLTGEVRKLFNQVRSTRRAKRHPERVEAYLARCRALVERAVETLDALRNQGADTFTCRSIEGFVAHARRQIDQVERRLLRDETIPHEEKVFSIFEGHTRWISKGKAGTPVELGVPVAIIEDQFGFILHHEVLWEGEDVDVAVPMVQEAQALYPELRACSFDRGFHSPDNRVRLDGLLDVNALPGKGYLSKANQEREAEESFVAARRAHPAVESAINGLEHRGLDRVRSHGADGFARTVALSVLAANLHRIGLLLQKRERTRRQRVA